MTELRRVVKERDDIDDLEFAELITDATLMMVEGNDPQDILQEIFGLEPDYMFDLLEEMS